MVGKRETRLAALLIGFCLALMVLAGGAPAGADVRPLDFDVEETFVYEINKFGDAHCTDTLKYDPQFFNKRAYLFDQYPFLLSRRFRSLDEIGEIKNFKSVVDRAKRTVTLTYDLPGRAYNKGDVWIVYYTSAPKFQNAQEFIFERESSVNNEYTLWNTLWFKVTTHIKLPPGAKNAAYDTTEKGVTYELPYVPPPAPERNFLQANRPIFVPVFAVLIAACLAGAAFVTFRSRRLPAPAVAFDQMSPQPALSPARPISSPSPLTLTPSPEESPAVSPAAETTATPGMTRSFCRDCGAELADPEYKFCPRCGRDRTS